MGDVLGNANGTKLIANDPIQSVILNGINILGYFHTEPSAIMPINYSTRLHSNFSYPGGNTFQHIITGTMAIADTQITSSSYNQWRMEFALNCYSMTNQTDKGFALFVRFVDGASAIFEPYCFNMKSPYTEHKNGSTYSQTSNS